MKQRLYIGSLFLVAAIGLTALPLLGGDSTGAETPKKDQVDIQNRFTPSGWMGDGEYGRKYIDFDGVFDTNFHTSPTCVEVTYRFGPKGWAGIYWQNKPDNWGKFPGTGFDKRGFTKLVFWARGNTGKETVEFKSGGIHDAKWTFHDSFEESTGRVLLAKEWKEYTIDLSKADLSSVIGGFCWVASQDFNKAKSITFYIDDITLE